MDGRMMVIEGGKWYNVSIRDGGNKFYYYNNKLHRELGPAIELVDGGKVWYCEGVKLDCKSQKEFETTMVKTAAAQPKYYDVKIETMLPATLTYRILANSPEDAFNKATKTPPTGVKHRLNGKKDLKATILEAGSSIVKLVKYLGK
jgi:hypothetical protein